MAEPHRSSNIASGSSSHKRSYDAIGPEADSDQTDVQHPTRSRRDSPPRPASGGEGSRERSKRARPDSNSSYASEVDHILLPTADSVSPSSSGSSHSSYHSAHSTLPGVASPPLLDVVDEDMLIDPVEPEPHATSPAGRIPSYIDTILSVSPRHSPAPSNPSRAPQRTSSEPFEENFARFLERATAFDREIAQLRSSPANLPTSSSRSANPLPPVYPPPELEDDFVIPDVYADIMPEVPSDHEDADEFQAFLRAPYTNPPSGRARVHGRGPLSGLRREDVVESVYEDVDQRALPSVHTASNPEVDGRARSPHSRFMDAYVEASAALRASLPPRVANMPRQRPLHIFPRPPSMPPAVPRDTHRTGTADEWSSSRNTGSFDISRHTQAPVDETDDFFDTMGRNSNARNRSESLQPLRSPRNAPSAPNRFFSLSERRPAGSPRSSARSVPQHVSSFASHQPRSSPRLPAPPVSNISRDFVDDRPWARVGDFDRTLREVEAHRRRMAEFLAEPLPPLPSYPGDPASPDLTIPTSSYSTLRHALDDTVSPDAPHREHSWVDEPTPPSAHHAHPSAWDITRWLSEEDDGHDAAPVSLQARYFSDVASPVRNETGLSALRRGPYRIRNAGEGINAGQNRPSSRTVTRGSPRATDDVPMSATASLLEANSRARSLDLSGLRHRARPHPPSRPRSPPPSPPPRRPDSATHAARSWARNDPPSMFSTIHAYPRFPPRTAEDDAMLQSFMDRPAMARRSSPERATGFGENSRVVEDGARSSRYGNINLDAYRDGPFRATLARSVALQHRSAVDQREAQDASSDRLEPVWPSPWGTYERRSSTDGDTRSTAAFERSHAASTADRWEQDAVHRRMRIRQELMDFRSGVGSTRASSPPVPEEHHARPFAALFDYTEYRPAPDTASAPPVASPPRPVYQTTETRSSTLREQAERRSALRHRTLLEREYSSSGSRADDPTLRAATTLERVERHRDMVQRILARRREVPGLPPISTSRNHTDPEGNTQTPIDDNPLPPLPQTSVWTRRYGRHASLSTHREGRPEDRPAPLNGRFARRAGFGPHPPPDMVWVDVPPAGRHPWMRRRNFGDYVRDEDFDFSYEGLLSLSSLLGDAKPRGTPDEVIASLPRGTYSEWARPGATEERCPICLDDYVANDPCLRVSACSHWFHEGCLQQWLKGARTCPVCRGRVSKPRSQEEASVPVAGPSGTTNGPEEDDDGNGDRENIGRHPRHWNPFRPPWRHD